MYFLNESIKYDQGNGVPQSEETFSVILTEIWTDFLSKPNKWIFKFHCNEMPGEGSQPAAAFHTLSIRQMMQGYGIAVTEAPLPCARL